MNILYIDESYHCDESKNPTFFVLGGFCITEMELDKFKQYINNIKLANNINTNSEIKWNQVYSRTNKRENPLQHLSIDERFENIIIPIIDLIQTSNVTLFSVLAYLPELKLDFTTNNTCKKFEDFYYHKSYENIIQRFQYHLQDETKNNNLKSLGMIIADNRHDPQNKALKNQHEYMLNGQTGKRKINYSNLIEQLLITESHRSLGIQIADIITGVIISALKNHNREKDLLSKIMPKFATYNGKPNGRGMVFIPHKSKYWSSRKSKARPS